MQFSVHSCFDGYCLLSSNYLKASLMELPIIKISVYLFPFTLLTLPFTFHAPLYIIKKEAKSITSFATFLFFLHFVAELPIIKILPDTIDLLPAYDSHTRHLRDDSTPKIASFQPAKVSDY